MTRNARNISLTLVVAAAFFGWSRSADAVPVQAQYIDDPAGCDLVPNTPLTHELGEAAGGFPINELIFADAKPTNNTVCGDDGIANDWEVRLLNLSNVYYKDLFFVVDESHFVGNWDGHVMNVLDGTATQAYRIDGTVTITAANNNLIAESGTVDEIFEPGEAWTFLVTNFTAPGGPVFDSIGFGNGSLGGPPSSASILANIVPEPTALSFLAVGGLAMLRRRKAGRVQIVRS